MCACMFEEEVECVNMLVRRKLLIWGHMQLNIRNMTNSSEPDLRHGNTRDPVVVDIEPERAEKH